MKINLYLKMTGKSKSPSFHNLNNVKSDELCDRFT